MDIYAQMAQKIIQQQEGIIGPIALEQAKKVSGLKIDWVKHEVAIEGDKTDAVERLIQNYEHLFGKASVEVCRDAVKGIINDVPKEKLPKSLQ
jgi:hypothetical protein